MKLDLVNVYLSSNDSSKPSLSIDQYTINQTNSIGMMNIKNHKKHTKTGYIEYSGSQLDSVIFKGGLAGSKDNPRERKFIEDILLIGSLLHGWNWELYSRKGKYPAFPLIPKPNVEHIELMNDQLQECFQRAIDLIKKPEWQRQYENGFHLRMFLNHANITNDESRFLSNFVIWEWLYYHLNDLDKHDRKDDASLQKVISSVVKKFWPPMRFEGKTIFQILRNQLAHSGNLPISKHRCKDQEWMSEVKLKFENGNPGTNDYMYFFGRLTQVIVLKTLGIDADHILRSQLTSFLEFGNIEHENVVRGK